MQSPENVSRADDGEIDPAILDIAENLRQAIGGFVRAIQKDAGTPRTAQPETLAILDRDGAMSVAALAQLRQVKHQSMRLVVALLEADGLVCRSADEADRRSQRVTITEAGRRVLSQARMARATSIAKVIQEQFSVRDRDTLGASISLLQRMTDALAL